jgi:hypothetical protein
MFKKFLHNFHSGIKKKTQTTLKQFPKFVQLEEAEIYEILNNNNKTITIKELIKGFPPEIILDFSEKDLIYLQRMDRFTLERILHILKIKRF